MNGKLVPALLGALISFLATGVGLAITTSREAVAKTEKATEDARATERAGFLREIESLKRDHVADIDRADRLARLETRQENNVETLRRIREELAMMDTTLQREFNLIASRIDAESSETDKRLQNELGLAVNTLRDMIANATEEIDRLRGVK